MKVTLTGREFKEFYKDESVWGSNEEFYYDDAHVTIDGADFDKPPYDSEIGLVPDESRVVVDGGVMLHQGLKEPKDGLTEKNFVKEIKKFLERSTSAYLLVQVDKIHVENFKDMLKNIKDFEVKVL